MLSSQDDRSQPDDRLTSMLTSSGNSSGIVIYKSVDTKPRISIEYVGGTNGSGEGRCTHKPRKTSSRRMQEDFNSKDAGKKELSEDRAPVKHWACRAVRPGSCHTQDISSRQSFASMETEIHN